MRIDFKFSKAFIKEAEEAIQEARKITSAEIFVHIDLHHEEEDDWERAEIVFDALKVAELEARNGVLIYVSMQDNALFIMGDTQVNEVVAENFFEEAKEAIINYFKLAQFGAGIVQGINVLSKKLSTVFPYNGEKKDFAPHVSVEE